MKRISRLSALFLLGITLSDAQDLPSIGNTSVNSPGRVLTAAVNVNLDSLLLDSVITAHRDLYKVPGIATMIVKGNEVIWNRNYGYKNRDLMLPVEDSTIFGVASVSKTFAATAVMQMVEHGLIDLDADIDKYLPAGCEVSNPYFPTDSITMRMLLTHTSSLGAEGSGVEPLEQCGDSPVQLDSFFVGYLTPGGKYYSVNQFYNYRPGTQWNYCNIDIAWPAPRLCANVYVRFKIVKHWQPDGFEQLRVPVVDVPVRCVV